MQLYHTLEQHLKTEMNYKTDEGDLKKWVVINKAQNYDAELLALLLQNDTLKAYFFVDVKGVFVFKQPLFIEFLEQKNYLNDSFTAYSNKIGLQIDGKYLKQRNEVSLVWPFKDCVLEGGQTTEEQKRAEIFFNETMAQDEITQLFEPKTLTAAMQYDTEGEHEFAAFKRNEQGTITDNLIIKGNNLLALHTLKKEFAGKVKLIYIDPPYNTGSDSFKYNDNFNHSTWLTFMKNRLDVAKELLSEDGAICINLDDSEFHYLKVLCDDLFGRDNFLNTIVWQRAYSPVSLNKYFSSNSDFILCYTKNINHFALNKLARTEIQKGRYKNPDNDVKLNWKPSDFSVGPAVEKNIYPIVLPSGRTVLPPSGRSWLVGEEKFFELVAENRIWFGTKDDAVPSLKKYESEVSEGITPLTIWTYQEVGHNQDAKRELKAFGFDNIFATPKPEKLLQRIIEIFTKEDDIVLDFFGGSGTTGAVAHKINRQYILVEQMDYIHDLPESRLKKVVGKIVKLEKDELQQTALDLTNTYNKAGYKLEFDEGGISKAVNWQGGGSFTYFELKKHNETFVAQIEKAADSDALLAIWAAMKSVSFLNYNIDIQKQDASIAEFQAFSVSEQKTILLKMLDKNQLYVNLSSLHDSTFACTEAEKMLTNDFYKK